MAFQPPTMGISKARPFFLFQIHKWSKLKFELWATLQLQFPQQQKEHKKALGDDSRKIPKTLFFLYKNLFYCLA